MRLIVQEGIVESVGQPQERPKGQGVDRKASTSISIYLVSHSCEEERRDVWRDEEGTKEI